MGPIIPTRPSPNSVVKCREGDGWGREGSQAVRSSRKKEMCKWNVSVWGIEERTRIGNLQKREQNWMKEKGHTRIPR